LTQEFIVVNQAKALAYLCFIMAKTPLKTQPWKPLPAAIEGLPARVVAGSKVNLTLIAAGLDLQKGRIAWEMAGQEPILTSAAVFTVGNSGPGWVEAEAQLPDGRRVFASTNFTIAPK
jgi:hypothetical protein